MPSIIAVVSVSSHVMLKAVGIFIRMSFVAVMAGVASSVIVIVEMSVVESPTANVWLAAEEIVGTEVDAALKVATVA